MISLVVARLLVSATGAVSSCATTIAGLTAGNTAAALDINADLVT